MPEQLRSPATTKAQTQLNQMMHSLSAKSSLLQKAFQPDSFMPSYQDPQKQVHRALSRLPDAKPTNR